MSCRSTVLFAVAAIACTLSGCRNCGDRFSWFTSNHRKEAPCQLMGSSGMKEGCYDAITGQPIPCPPEASIVPGGGIPGIPPRANELPFPGPADMITPPGVPSAPPGPAPAPIGAAKSEAKGDFAGKTTAPKQ
jgi:hypothetical protein